jgi:hypothetical protein
MLLTATLFAMGSALLAEQQQCQQEAVAAPDPVDDDRTLLDVFGEVAKEYLMQQVVCVCSPQEWQWHVSFCFSHT